MKTLTKIAIAAGAVALATTAMAQPKPENFVKQRQSALALIGWYFGPLGAVAKGEKPFNKDDAVRATSYLVALSKMPWEGFVAGTENVGNTKAKPEIWSKAADFKKAADNMQTEMAKLAQLASAGDEAGFKKQFGAVGGTCKACHDDFRKQ
ncbi:MAG TPA: cytochrome c [Casimicrobium huifangae]|jgi:cytochrome c556|nr:cytochrome c [Casimicrobium huifangae]HQD65195.1 cytochrome c [Casimicrobium huifangae]